MGVRDDGRFISGGNLSISDNALLATISGFSALETINGSLSIGGGRFSGGNPALTTLPTFNALQTIRRSLNINNNFELTSISGFSALDTIGFEFSIRNNDKLTSISGFSTLDTIGFDFSIRNNDKLTSISGFEALESVSDRFRIDDNAGLTTIPTFDALTTIEGSLSISRNAALQTISGFPVLRNIGNNRSGTESSLSIEYNDLLTSISGFGSLIRIRKDFIVENNATLSSCCGLLRFVDGTVAPGGFTGIDKNAAGCNSVTEIRANCDASAPTTPPAPATMIIDEDSDIPSNVASITRITSGLSIGGTITEFPDFAALEVVEGNLIIRGITTPALTRLEDIFPSLESVRGSLQIQGHTVVQTISGFNALENIGDEFAINDNDVLASISGFNALRNIGSSYSSGNSVLIENNDLLTSISGFGVLVRIRRDFIVENNATLSACCELLRFVDGTVAPGGFTGIYNNAMGCNSVAEIKANCSTSEVPDESGDKPVVGLPTLAQHLRFYPNPASHTLYIEGISQETDLIIRTFSGKTLLRTTLHQNQAVDIASLPQGTYILTLQSGQEQRTRRLVIGL